MLDDAGFLIAAAYHEAGGVVQVEDGRARLMDLVRSLNQARQEVESPLQAVGRSESGRSDESRPTYALLPWQGQPTERTW